MVIFHSHVGLPEGKTSMNPMKNHNFPVVFLGFSYGETLPEGFPMHELHWDSLTRLTSLSDQLKEDW